MKQSLIFIFILSFLLTACTDRKEYNELLIQADSLIQSSPDSALNILEGIMPNSLNTKADHAYYALLLTKARDKNYILQKNDSLIETAVRYYDTTKETGMQAQAYYYWGSVYRDKNEQAKAINKYLRAIPLAQKAKDKVLLGRIYANAGYIYYLQDFYDKADSIYRQAERIGFLLKDTSLWAEAVAMQGKIQLYQNQDFKAEEKLHEALSILGNFKQDGIRADIASALSSLYSKNENGEKALRYAKQNLSLQKDTAHCYRAFLILGDAYYKMGQYDSAYYYIKKSLSSSEYGTRSGAYMRLGEIIQKQGKLIQSLEMERLYSIYKDSLAQSSQSNDVTKVEQKIRIQEQQSQIESFLSKYKSFIFSLVIVCFITLYLLRYYYNRLLKKQRKNQQRIEEELHMKQVHQQKQLEEKNKEIKVLQQQITQQHCNDKQEAQIAELHYLRKQRIALIKEMVNIIDVNTKVNQILSDYKEKGYSKIILSENEWARLMAEIDKNEIIHRICNDYQLTDEEYYICCLQSLDYTVTDMGHLLRCERLTVYRKEKKILEKMGLGYEAGKLKRIINSLICGHEIGI